MLQHRQKQQQHDIIYRYTNDFCFYWYKSIVIFHHFFFFFYTILHFTILYSSLLSLFLLFSPLLRLKNYKSCLISFLKDLLHLISQDMVRLTSSIQLFSPISAGKSLACISMSEYFHLYHLLIACTVLCFAILFSCVAHQNYFIIFFIIHKLYIQKHNHFVFSMFLII